MLADYVQLLRQLQAANSGHLHAIERVLQHTYGRRGAVKHRLLKVRDQAACLDPFLSY